MKKILQKTLTVLIIVVIIAVAILIAISGNPMLILILASSIGAILIGIVNFIRERK
jgi:hypothetical protein